STGIHFRGLIGRTIFEYPCRKKSLSTWRPSLPLRMLPITKTQLRIVLSRSRNYLSSVAIDLSKAGHCSWVPRLTRPVGELATVREKQRVLAVPARNPVRVRPSILFF